MKMGSVISAIITNDKLTRMQHFYIVASDRTNYINFIYCWVIWFTVNHALYVLIMYVSFFFYPHVMSLILV